jgi:hypothetical protein
MASGWDQGTGKVIRANGRNTGSTIWDQDASAGQVIDSLGHDVHDQRLADSISDTLHIGGYNSMQANINAGGYKIVGLAKGTDPNDGVHINQYYDEATFDEGSRVLTISAPDGTTMTVEIPSGAGGGTVTQIGFGEGISSTAEPLTSTGTISLDPVSPNPSGTYINGIQGIVIDQYGRVTEVTDEYGVGIDLGTTRDATTVTITNTGGANAVIPIATTTLAGAMSAADKTKLDGLVQNVDLGATSNPTTVTITNTGGANATISEATGTNAGIMTVDMHNKLDSIPTIDPGTSSGQALQWNGSKWAPVAWPGGGVDPGTVDGAFLRWSPGVGEWVQTTQITNVAGGYISIRGGSTSSTYPFAVGDNSHIDGDLVVTQSMAIEEAGGGLAVGGIAINQDSLPNIEWNPNADAVAGFQQSSDGTYMNVTAKTQGAGDGYFRYVRSGADVTFLEALNGAQFKGTVVASLSSRMTTTEYDAMIDFFVAQGILTAARAATIKGEIVANNGLTSVEVIPTRNITVG